MSANIPVGTSKLTSTHLSADVTSNVRRLIGPTVSKHIKYVYPSVG